jgi:hypothetical protein
MPTDVSFGRVQSREDVSHARRLPIGFGLVIAVGASVALWVGIFIAFRALFG